jgi:hypothetical protein
MTSLGKFYVPIKATLPEHTLEFPSKMDFSFCPINETAKKQLLLKNTGELKSDFEWEVPQGFRIYPNQGSLDPGDSLSLKIEFTPLV